MAKNINVGLFIPTSGDAGIWGPSCWTCAELAADEINRSGGVAGSMVRLQVYDAGRNPVSTARLANQLIDMQLIDVIVGMHTSDIREEICRQISDKIPYIYTPLWEGGIPSKRTLCIGETPNQQLAPSLHWLSDRYNFRKLYLIGHDYIWPRITNWWLKQFLKYHPQEVIAEKYLAFEVTDFSEIIDEIEHKEPCAVIVSLVGDGSVQFNRQFGCSGLSRKIVRLSTAIEENILLAIGESRSEGIFVSSGYFACLDNSLNGNFRERYHSRYGEYGPPLNAIGHSVYEGVHLLRQVFESPRAEEAKIPLPGAREGKVQFGVGSEVDSLFLAEAQGLNFNIVKEFNNLA